jgi:hypothetical protein
MNAAPAVVAHLDAGIPLLVTEIDARLTAAGIPLEEGDDAAPGTEPISAPTEWFWAGLTRNHVTAIINGLSTDGPKPGKERHHWLLKQSVRLACARRLGWITETDYRRAQQLLAQRFTELVRTTEPRREPLRFELSGAEKYGIAKASTKTGRIRGNQCLLHGFE